MRQWSCACPRWGALQSVLSQALPVLTQVSLGGRLSTPADYGSVRLRGATLSAHELQVAGDVTIGLASAMAIDGLLHATRLDLDALLAASGAPRSGRRSNLKG